MGLDLIGFNKCFGYGSTYPSCFQYLVELNIHVYHHSSWHVLQDLLQNAPNLEFLVVTNEHRLYPKESLDDPHYLTLEVFIISDFKDWNMKLNS
uniref:Uncharacterized protein n=1 Tax=Quercus lobata TaxID=97700 RepID=A0A7N2MA86_QUELO